MHASIKPLAIAAFALAASLGAAQAQDTVDASQPEALLALMQGFGAATLGVDDYGDPMIETELAGRPVSLQFRHCVENVDCKLVSFYARWEQPDVPDYLMPDWNAQTLLSRAYEESPGVQVLTLDVNLVGGVTAANFTDTIDWFAGSVADFQDQVIDAAAGN